MSERDNLVHEKLKKANPNDLINFQVKLPAFLLKDVRTYGDTAKVLKNALSVAQGNKHLNNLKELISELKKYLELLEEDNSLGELDEVHNLLIETYRDVYLRLKGAEILRRRRKA